MLSWLMFVATGIGPYSGQARALQALRAEGQLDYAHNRYQFEAQRHYTILNDTSPSSNTWSATPTPSSTWRSGAGRGMAPFVLGEDALAKYPNVKRLVDEISARPAAARAIALKDKFTFKAEMDDEARGIMFRHLKTKAA